jgi:hypothetical protein
MSSKENEYLNILFQKGMFEGPSRHGIRIGIGTLTAVIEGGVLKSGHAIGCLPFT